jgi:hypothetical protein
METHAASFLRPFSCGGTLCSDTGLDGLKLPGWRAAAGEPSWRNETPQKIILGARCSTDQIGSVE